ncbi:unnamed protein product [Caenorhabditis auriculariae]|uniref:PLD phosphodiesterase domain-containing protein n=1 Tax=Caenorhabditis auriculariae TaxID=2777116 RepID=A0A8S1HKX0_9PELO|nr:unnamed protein product [Caenorhabditis auriculariae]
MATVNDDVELKKAKGGIAGWLPLITLLFPFAVLSGVLHINGKTQEQLEKERQCFETCSIRIVESIPTNLTFGDVLLPMSTYEAWTRLIVNAEHDLAIAAYKSSLQGKHVLGQLDKFYSNEGDSVYDSILKAGKAGKAKVRMVENYPPKDKGDNADGIILQNFGAVSRRSIDISNYLGRGKMHSKFLLADGKSFYLGSANLDWRSLNQKMELGVLVENCACLGEDMTNIFDSLWLLTKKGVRNNDALSKRAAFNRDNPLKIQVHGQPADVYIATSPKELSNRGRTWDLDAIVGEIDAAKKFIDVHVMDYFPLFLYRKPQLHFPQIDDALRRAIVRGVKVRLLSAALHYPNMGTRFLRSLQSLNNIRENATIQVKIFKVPTSNTDNIVIQRERRTHNKFMVTESAVIIGTSNWSGDYFIGGTTGAAIVMKQTEKKRPLVEEMKAIFERDWESAYAHPLDDYFENCVKTITANFCEGEKDPRLFASPQMME